MRAPSPALVVSVIALFIALGGTTYAATSLPANSVGTAQLKNGAVTTVKISKSTVSGLAADAAGSVLTFDGPATANPSPTTLGTVLGDTWSAECALSEGHADILVFLKTSDGSWTWDGSAETSASSASAFRVVAPGPAGHYSTARELGTYPAGAAPSDFELQEEGLQLAPAAGYLALHLTALDTTAPSQSCHMSVDAIPQKVVAKKTLRRRR
jgi:hypothetical protein